MQEHKRRNEDERTQFFRKIYLSLYLKGFERFYCVRGELETEQNCNILTPTLMAITAFLSRSLGLLNRGPEGPLCWVLVLFTASFLQLTQTSCAPSYIIVLCPLNSTCRQSRLFPWYLQPDAPVIYTGTYPILTAQPGSICNTWNSVVSFYTVFCLIYYNFYDVWNSKL